MPNKSASLRRISSSRSFIVSESARAYFSIPFTWRISLTRQIFVGFLSSAVTLLCITGCGPESNTAYISGTVSIDGKPTDKGSISFIPVNGQGPTAGAEIKDGKFNSQAALGECKVEVRVPKVVGKKKLYDTPDSPIQDVMEEVLPSKFNEASELRIDIKKGTNTKDWDLKTK